MDSSQLCSSELNLFICIFGVGKTVLTSYFLSFDFMSALSATNLDRRPSATKLKRSPIPLKGGAAKQKLKSAFSKVKCAAGNINC